jgi:4-amino-4-deoxy-L-arabinose transferase-like glycosyltransferase
MKCKILLALIFLVFIVTRVYKITTIPSSVYWDEASIGYNAFAITTDLKDEWGNFLPLHFRAFGEFKLPVYIYSVASFVKLFGLNEYSVRLPAVIYSLGTLFVVYLLSKKINDK